MENERLRIKLNKSDNLYVAGETIVGEILLNLVKRTKIRAIKVQITGKGKCKWMEIMRKNTNVDNKSLFYTGKRIYVRDQITLPAFEPRGLELNPGEHKFEFNVPLKPNLPSTFKGSYGAIKYKLRILLQRPWMFDERHIVPITVIKCTPVPFMQYFSPMPMEKQITRTISLFGNRPITMVALLPQNFAVRGEPMRICVSVLNGSNTTVEKLRFTVLQCITYWSVLPIRWDKCEMITIVTKETGAVHKQSERTFAHELMIPMTAQPTDNERSDIINITYELKVEAVLRGFFKNLKLNFRFDLYSSHTENSFENAANQAARLQDILNMVPNLTISTSSSSNSESSSMNSTASDSSTATLSPAIGCGNIGGGGGGGNGTAPSCTSESSSSSQFNSPSTRASLYNATNNVPQTPYPSSNSMTSTSTTTTTTTRTAIATTTTTAVAATAATTTITTATATTTTATTTAANTPPSYSQAFNESSQQQQHQQQTITALPQSLTVNLNNSNSSNSSNSSSNGSSAYAAPSFLTMRPPSGFHELPPSYEELFGNAPEPPIGGAK